MDIERLAAVLRPYPAYRFGQAARAVFRDFAPSWEEATNLPQKIREILKRECPLEINARREESRDGKTVKAVISLEDGEAIEAVLMRHPAGRTTVCVSSQAGCGLGCDFCATGARGFGRNLKAPEIVDQVLLFGRALKGENRRVTNVVFMGMGEPLLNYEPVMEAVRVINRPDTLRIGARRISISTVGIVEGIARLAREGLQVNLGVSLHAPDDRLRSRLLPVNDRFPIKKVLQAVAEYIEITRRRVMIEYLMLKDINDSPAQARQLAELLKGALGRLFFVNLISYNPVGKYRPSPPGGIEKFKNTLKKAGIEVIQRYRFGLDIKGGCGMLAGMNGPRP